jgi:hypothetical protein
MMTKSLAIRVCRMSVPVLLLMASLGARAADLDADNATVADAKAHGIIGEQSDGMLGVVRGDPDAGIMGAVAELNEMRTESYRQAAARSGDTAQAEGRKAGEKLIGEVSPGQSYKPSRGGWTRK